MAALETKIAAHKAALADPALFSKNPSVFERTAAELAQAEKTLAAAEEEWLQLEMKREALQG